MAGQISDFIDIAGLEREVREANAAIDKLEAKIREANEITLKVTVDYKGVNTLNDYAEATKKYKDAVETLTDIKEKNTAATAASIAANNRLADAMKLTDGIIAQHNGHSKEFVTVLDKVEAAELKAAKTATETAKARRENAKALVDEAKYTEALTKTKEKLEKAAEKESEEARKLTNEYETLKRSYITAANAAKELGIALGTDSKEFKIAQEAASGMYAKLIEVEKAVGQAQRQVGQYNQAQFAMSQLLREAPSFAYSFSTGLLGISNNIPILVDEITRLKIANEALKESGQTTIPIWKTLLGALTSPVGIITVITSAITILAARFDSLGTSMKKLSEYDQIRTDFYKEYDKAQKSAIENTAREKATLEVLYATSQNLNNSLKDRELAVRKMQDLYPDYFGNLTKEKILAGEATDQYNDLILAIERSAKTRGITDSLSEVEASLTMKRDRLKKLRVGDIDPKTGEQTRYYAPSDIGEEDRLQRQIDFLEEKKKSLLADIDAPLRADQKVSKEHQKKDTSKGLTAELALEDEAFRTQVELNQRKFNSSAKTFADERRLDAEQLAATNAHAAKMLDIIEKWHGKAGESETKYNERKAQVAREQLKSQGEIAENEAEIARAIEDRHIKEGEAIDAVIEKTKKQREELENLGRQYDLIGQKSAIDHSRAEGANPFLESLGFDNKFNTDKAKRDADIAAKKQALDDLNKRFDSDPLAKKDQNRALEYAKDIAKQKNDIAQLEADQQAAIDNKIIEGKKKVAQQTVELAQQAFEAISAIRNNGFAQEQQQLQTQQQQLQISSQQKIAAVNATTNFQIAKDNQIAKITAQTAAQQNELQRQQNELALKKAKGDKQAAEAGVILNTALAIAKALPLLANPLTVPTGIAQIALITATGAVQYAAAASTPLPAYAAGTGDAGTTSRTFIAGEKGPELGVTPSGQTMMFDKPGIYTAPIGTSIKNADETARLIRYAINGIGYNGNSLAGMVQPKANDMTDKRIVEELQELRNDVVQAAMIGRTVKNNITVTIDNDLQRK